MKNVNIRKNNMINNAVTRGLKSRLSSVVNAAADKLKASVEADRVSLLQDEVERLQLKKYTLLASLEVVSTELHRKEQELKNLTIQVPLDAIPA